MKSSQRILKVNSLLQEEISKIVLLELNDPRFNRVTIMEVETSLDLRNAKVFFSVLGEAEEIQAAQEALDKAAGYIYKQVAHRVHLKYIPHLHFIYDNSTARGARILELLNNLEIGEDEI